MEDNVDRVDKKPAEEVIGWFSSPLIILTETQPLFSDITIHSLHFVESLCQYGLFSFR